MRKLFCALSLAVVVLFTSCDDEESTPAVDFQDQNAQGTINDQTFSLGEASASPSLLQDSDLSFQLFDSSESFTDVCDFFGFGDNVSVFFSLPAEVGVYNLNIDLSNLDGQTATLFDPAETLNIIATQGAIEILTITDTLVTGRLDVRDGSGNSVNGNFTATRCQ